ncbi:MAG: dethiobiotin synthase [Balneolaceae bacterium]|nr:dethiobiotin synthase [Balneolaceae bacterium]
MDFPERFMVSGTDTGIGKSLVSAVLTLGLGGVYWKPVQSGLEGETDTEFVRRVTGLGAEHFRPERWRLNEPLSPHAAAAIDGVEIALDDFELPEHREGPLVVEGAGGLLVPLNGRHMIIDLAERLELPVLLTVRSELGTLNHTFLSLEALRRRDIPVLGVVMNGPRNRSNREAIERFGEVEVLAEIEPLEEINPGALECEFQKFNA